MYFALVKIFYCRQNSVNAPSQFTASPLSDCWMHTFWSGYFLLSVPSNCVSGLCRCREDNHSEMHASQSLVRWCCKPTYCTHTYLCRERNFLHGKNTVNGLFLQIYASNRSELVTSLYLYTSLLSSVALYLN